jgi:hypothetical protein
MIRPYARVTERPDEFQVDLSAPLFARAVFLGLGGCRGSFKYRDCSTYGNHGLLTGYTGAGNTPVDRWGRALGRASLSFDGTADIIDVPSSPSLQLYSGTVTMFVRSAAWRNQYLLCKKNTTGYLIEFYANKLYVVTSGQGNSTSVNQAWTPANAIWYHLAFTWGNGVSWFVNGSQIGATQAQTYYPDANSGNLQFGTATPSYSNTFNGSVADLCLWNNRILSPAEIMQLADPSDVMLSGLIRDPRPNRSFVGQVGGAPAGNRRRRLIICGSAA